MPSPATEKNRVINTKINVIENTLKTISKALKLKQ
jgi:hypothetical protein